MGDHGPTENGLAPVQQNRLIGSVGNVAHQAPKWLFRFGSYELAIVEFDDQGVYHDPGQMRGLAETLSDLRENGKDVIIVVFVHGWKHDARSDDGNLADFRKVLEQAIYYEEQQAKSQSPPQAPRPVVGVYVGWRGMSLYDNRFHVLENITFWGRQAAGRRVATGSVRELFGHLRYYHRKRKEEGGSPLFVVVGHSFGGMIVYGALAQALIEAAATPEVPPSLADLVLLVNPAIEAARYLPIPNAVVKESQTSQARVQQPQPPIFVCVQAKNDWATRFAFRIGNLFSSLVQKAKDRRQRQAIRNTIGHVPRIKTHDLAAGSATDGGTGYKLSPSAQDGVNTTPFWVVQATPEVINGHGGIFKDRFLYFVAGLVFRHVDDTTGRTPNMALQAHALARPSS